MIQVSFDAGVGLTSGDVWWAYVNSETGPMDRWGMVLEGQEGPRRYTTWTGWERFGPILLATERRLGGRTLRFGGIVVSDRVPEGAFDVLKRGDR